MLPDLLRDLGAPFPAIWDQLHEAHGPRDAARLFAKVLGQLETQGATVVVPALTAALERGTPLLLALTPARPSRASRSPRCQRRWATSRWGAGVRPTTTAGSWRWRDERRPDAHWPHEDYLHEVLSAEQAPRHESVIPAAAPGGALSRDQDARHL